MLAHVSKVMDGKKPEGEDRMGPVDSSTARTLERDALLASMLQEIEDRRAALLLTWEYLLGAARVGARARQHETAQREWWKLYRVCSCRREEKEEEKSE